jgi:hypothetical protein
MTVYILTAKEIYGGQIVSEAYSVYSSLQSAEKKADELRHMGYNDVYIYESEIKS